MSLAIAIVVTVAAYLLLFVGLNVSMGRISGASVKETGLAMLAQLVFHAVVVGGAFGLAWVWSGVPS